MIDLAKATPIERRVLNGALEAFIMPTKYVADYDSDPWRRLAAIRSLRVIGDLLLDLGEA